MKKALRIFLIVVAVIMFFLFMAITAHNQTDGVRSEKYIHR
jgi:hypothetical protein